MSQAHATTVSRQEGAPGLRWWAVLLVALSLSIGWGVRGNWGHEYGAMIPGALAAMAACLVADRKDWRRRIMYFAFFGALGWSFGGSISYMQVIGYTHGGHRESVLYGFACLFLIGFLWGAMGGVGTLLPALLDRQRLTDLFPPILCVFGAWVLEDVLFALIHVSGQPGPHWFGQAWTEYFQSLSGEALEWYDTDWLAALLAMGAVMLLCIVRRRICFGSSLVLHMAVGWWLAFTILVPGLGLRMTPPRGDSWAGALGMTIGMFVFLWRNGLADIGWGGLLTGWFGGLGFSGATLIKLCCLTMQVHANWHSVLEQTYGFINGIGIAVTLGYFSIRAPRQSDDPPIRRWTEQFCVAFVMLGITWLNISKNVQKAWLPNHVVPEEMHGLSTDAWFALAYLLVALVFLVVLFARRRGKRIPVMPSDWLGKGQLLYLAFLWWIVIGNAARCFPFHPQRLVTEGVIHVHACICTILVLLVPREEQLIPAAALPYFRDLFKRTAWWGLVAAAAVVVGELLVTRSIYGDLYTGDKYPGFGYASKHIRFGPEATINDPKLK